MSKDKKLNKKVFVDQIHGIRAISYSRLAAFQEIRDKCKESGLKAPMLSQVKEIDK